MRPLFCSFLLLLPLSLFAAQSEIKMNFKNEDILNVIEYYSKASGQKFVVDPAVHGKVSIFNQGPVSLSEAFNQLSTALAVNSLAISKRDGLMVIGQARSIQRSLIEVGTTLPSLQPERMYTWIYNCENASAMDLNKELRILQSTNGEMVVNQRQNQMVFTDWVSNLHRISAILKEADKKLPSKKAAQ